MVLCLSSDGRPRCHYNSRGLGVVIQKHPSDMIWMNLGGAYNGYEGRAEAASQCLLC